MRFRGSASYFWTVIAILLVSMPAPLFAYDPFPAETALRSIYYASPLTLKGRVVDSSGKPLAGCNLRLSGGASTFSLPDGTFILGGVSRSNQLLTITAQGYYQHLLPVQLFVPLAQTNVTLPPVILAPQTPTAVRFLFGGDTTFARRMLDPLERAPRDQMPIENPEAIIQVTNPLPGTLEAVSYVKPLFLAADYPVVNLETVVTRDPSTPHRQKDFCYFTLPESLPALKTLNIDYVGLGNNHTYDYLESGVSNTCYNLDVAGLHHSGLGSNSTTAFEPYRTAIKGTPFSFLAMTSIGGEQFAVTYVASTNKGGAAYIESTSEARAAIAAERTTGFVTIVQTHVGDEYTFEPSPSALKWMKLGVDAGADLLVAHHPHVAQGFGMHRGVLIMHCLGNLCFDQDRLETMQGLLATVDMEGHHLRRAWGTPIYLEDYRPRPLCGRAAAVFLRRISEYSQQLRVFPYNNQAWVITPPSRYSFNDRRLVVPVSVGSNGWAAIDLRDFTRPEESLARIEAETSGLLVRPGRDILYFGDFEDVDVDGERGEASRWDFNTNSTVALQNPYRGTASLCLYRKSTLTSDGLAALRNRVRVVGDSRDTPNKELSLIGYVRGQQAGRISIVSHYYASEGTNDFGEELSFEHPGGTFDWTQFAQDLHMPPDDPSRVGDPSDVNARAVRVFLHHSPPVTGTAYAWFDELAVVSWEETLDPLTGPVLNTPHARDFLRVQGPAGTYQLALTFRSYKPSETDLGHGPALALETEQPNQSVDHLSFRSTGVGFEDVLRLVVRNLGDQTLVVSNLTFISGDSTDFLARWVSSNGGSVAGIMSIPPNGLARLEVRFVPAAAGSRNAVLQFQSNDPDQDQSLIKVEVGGDAYASSPVRYITANRTLSPAIHIQVPATAVPYDVLWEQLPTGSLAVSISNGGQWDPASRTVQWRDVAPGATVSYQIAAATNAAPLSGWLAAAGQTTATAGDSVAIVLAPPDADGDGLPDWWEHKFFDSRTAAVPEVDSDGDGQSNLAEFVAGTHPLDGGFQTQPWAPYLRQLAAVDGALAELQILGFEGVTYRLEESTDLQSWRTVTTNLFSGDPIAMPWTVPPGPIPLFYRAAAEDR